MSSQMDNFISLKNINKDSIFTSSDYKERQITMSITESKSFDSIADENDIRITFTSSSDSLDYDDNVLGRDFGSDDDDEKDNSSSRSGKSSQVPSPSKVTNVPENHRHIHHIPPPPHGYHMPPYAGPPGSHPHYHPHYQHHYYPNGGNPPHFPPGGSNVQFDHRFPPHGPQGPYHPGMSYRQSSYPPPHPNYHNQAYRQNANSSSAMSVSSQGSRKRTIDGLLEDDERSGSFSKHRSSSNNSTCSTNTAGNNTSSETFNRLICNSPMKRERTFSPESRESSLNFGDLNMGKNLNGKKMMKYFVDYFRSNLILTNKLCYKIRFRRHY